MTRGCRRTGRCGGWGHLVQEGSRAGEQLRQQLVAGEADSAEESHLRGVRGPSGGTGGGRTTTTRRRRRRWSSKPASPPGGHRAPCQTAGQASSRGTSPGHPDTGTTLAVLHGLLVLVHGQATGAGHGLAWCSAFSSW